MRIQKYQSYIGTFQPKETTDLDKYSMPVGEEALFQALFIYDRGPFTGQWALSAMYEGVTLLYPSGDVVIERNATHKEIMATKMKLASGVSSAMEKLPAEKKSWWQRIISHFKSGRQ